MALPHAKPGEIVDLEPMGSGLSRARTAAIVKTDQLEVIRLILPAGAEIPPHKVSGEITLHCLEGHVTLTTDAAPMMLKAHQWVYLAGGALHSVKAIEDASLLVTISLR